MAHKLQKKEIEDYIFKHYFERDPKEVAKEGKNGKITKSSESESLFFVKHGVTGDWFKLARGYDQQIRTPGDNLRFYYDLKKVLQSNEILEVYRRRIARMLGGLLGLQPHALMIGKDKDEAVR